MGNIFIDMYSSRNGYSNMDIRCVCGKCGDSYKPGAGSYSLRTSCRFHDFDENGECKQCHQYKNHIRSNCYHYKGKTCWESMTS